MKVLLYPNLTRPDAVAFAEEIRNALAKIGVECCQSPEDGNNADFCIVVGGDGTVLRAVRSIPEIYFGKLPVWSVNCGHLGYLTDCEKGEALSILPKIAAGEHRTEKRILISGKMISSEHAIPFFALNEAVIHRSGFSRSLNISLSIDGKGVLKIFGDGLLISTPTGSTAYNLSAGGPLLLPESRLMVITPICPHSPLCAPLVVPGNSSISVEIEEQSGNEEEGRPQLTVDGCQHIPFLPGDKMTCTMSGESVSFIQTDESSFYSKLASKLLKNS